MAAKKVAPPTNNAIRETGACVRGRENATAIMTDSRDVAEYASWFERLEGIASFGNQAAAVIEQIAEDYRSLT